MTEKIKRQHGTLSSRKLRRFKATLLKFAQNVRRSNVTLGDLM